MASTISACSSASTLARASFVPKSPVSRPSALGLPAMSKVAKTRCSMERKTERKSELRTGGASLMSAAAVVMSSPAAMALVDQRMGTEGTGLPFGLNNNLLGWILLGVLGLTWSFYMVYTSGLEEDEESGLSL